jgi:hypothetical protein
MLLSLLQVLESFVISWLLVDMQYMVFSPPFNVALLMFSHYANWCSLSLELEVVSSVAFSVCVQLNHLMFI